MVLLHLDVVLVALDVCLVIDGVLSEGVLTVAHAVALDVGLGHDIEAILVTKVVPAGVIAVMASAYSIHIELLHDADVLYHAVDADNVAAVGIKLMAVSTLDQDGLTIDKYLSALNLYVAEADALAYGLNDVAALVLEGEGGGVEVGQFSTPGLSVGHGEGGNGGTVAHSYGC